MNSYENEIMDILQGETPKQKYELLKKIQDIRIVNPASHFSFELTVIQTEYMKMQAIWIQDSVSRPIYNDKYFVLIEDNGSLLMDIIEHCGTKNHGDTYYGWETFDQRKYTNKAHIKYWLQHNLI